MRGDQEVIAHRHHNPSSPSVLGPGRPVHLDFWGESMDKMSRPSPPAPRESEGGQQHWDSTESCRPSSAEIPGPTSSRQGRKQSRHRLTPGISFLGSPI